MKKSNQLPDKQNADSLVPVCNFKYVREMMNNDNSLVLGVIDAFMKQLPSELVCLTKAIEEVNFAKIKTCANDLAASAAILGINELSPVLIMMKRYAKSGKELNQIKKLIRRSNKICWQAIEELNTESLKLSGELQTMEIKKQFVLFLKGGISK